MYMSQTILMKTLMKMQKIKTHNTLTISTQGRRVKRKSNKREISFANSKNFNVGNSLKG